MTYQRNRGITLLNNYNDALKNYELALNSAGTADKKFAIYQESTKAAIDKAKASFESFAQGLFDSKTIKTAITSFTELIDVLNTLITNPISIGIIQIGLLTASFYALGKAITFIGSTTLISGIGSLINSIRLIAIGTSSLSTEIGVLTTRMALNPLFWGSLAAAAGAYAFVKLFDAAIVSAKELKEDINNLSSSVQSLQSEKDKLLVKDNLTEQEKKHLAILEAQIKAQKTLLADKAKLSIDKEYTSNTGYNSTDENEFGGISSILNNGSINNTADAIKGNIEALKQYNQELKNLDPTLDGAYDKEQKLNVQKAEAIKFLGEQDDALHKLMTPLEETNQQNSDEYKLLTSLSTAIEDVIGKTNAEADAIFDAYSKTKLADADFYNALKASHTSLFANLSALYGNDVKNWTNLAQAKEAIELGLIKNLGNAWAKYFEAFQAGTIVSSKSTSDAMRLLKGDVTAVSPETYKQFEMLDQLAKASADMAKKFKDLDTPENTNVGSSKKEATEKELYESKEYEQALSEIDKQLDILNADKQKLDKTSQQYQDTLRKEIVLLQKKQDLAHAEANSLRKRKNDKLWEINQIAGADYFSLSDTKRQSIFDSLYNPKKNEKQKYFNDLLKDFDNLSKRIDDCQSSYRDWQLTIDTKNIEIVTSKLEQFDKAILDINDKLQRNKSEMQNLVTGTTAYSNKLQEQITLTKEYIQALQEKQRFLEIEIALETTNMARKNELIDILKNVKQTLFDVQIDLTSQLAAQADEVISIYKDMYEKQKDIALDAIDDQIDAEEKRHKNVTDNLDEEQSQYEDLIKAKLKLLEKEADQESYTKKLTKAQKESQEIQNKIDILSLDDSFEGRAKKEVLEKELAEKLGSIEEMQNQHTLDARKDNLNDLLDSNKKEVDSKKKTEDKIYKIEKDRLEKIKKETQRYWENMINDERKWAQLKVDIINGNLNEVKNSFVSFTNILNGNLTTIGQSIVNNLIDKMAKAKTAIDAINSQMSSLPSDIGSGSGNNSNTVINTSKSITKGMLLTVAGEKANVKVTWKDGIYYFNDKGFGSSIPGTHVNQDNRNIIDDPEIVKRILKNFGGTFHEGGVTENGNPLVQKVNGLFNLKSNEVMIKSLIDELHIPPKNLVQHFVPNMSALVSSLTPQISIAGGGSGDANYYMDVHIAKVENTDKGVDSFFKRINQGMSKLGK